MDIFVGVFNKIIKNAIVRYAELFGVTKERVQIIFTLIKTGEPIPDPVDILFWAAVDYKRVLVPAKGKKPNLELPGEPISFNELADVRIDLLGYSAGVPEIKKILIALCYEYEIPFSQISIALRLNDKKIELFLYSGPNLVKQIQISELFE